MYIIMPLWKKTEYKMYWKGTFSFVYEVMMMCIKQFIPFCHLQVTFFVNMYKYKHKLWHMFLNDGYFSQFLYFWEYILFCVSGGHYTTHVSIRRQIVGVSPLPLPCGFQGLKQMSTQTQCLAHFPTESSHSLAISFFQDVIRSQTLWIYRK